MFGLGTLQALFLITAFLFQIILIIHFALRRWRFEVAIRQGWIVYALGILAAAVSLVLLLGRLAWSFCLGGFLYLIWGMFGYWAEYVKKIEWRQPIYWPVFSPYIILYLATTMFYWFPLALISKPLWYIYAALFIFSTVLNVTSHQQPGKAKKVQEMESNSGATQRISRK